MISVVIPTLNAEATLAATLAALVPAAVDGLVREVIVVDGGSSDRTAGDRRRSRRRAGARRRRARQPARGRAPRRRASPGCCSSTPTRCWRPAGSARPANSWSASIRRAAGRRRGLPLRARRQGARPRVLERLVALRCAALRLPYGDQGLLIPKRLYDEIGGYRPLPLMEDVDLVRRLGRRRMVMLRRARGDQRRALPPRGLCAPLRPQSRSASRSTRCACRPT